MRIRFLGSVVGFAWAAIAAGVAGAADLAVKAPAKAPPRCSANSLPRSKRFFRISESSRPATSMLARRLPSVRFVDELIDQGVQQGRSSDQSRQKSLSRFDARAV
jgi:hypothetical protein